MTDEPTTYRCPIDGAELAPGQACPEHGIAYGTGRATPATKGPRKVASVKRGRKR
jgi:hypothetical protein